jgi:hypothetical protein
MKGQVFRFSSELYPPTQEGIHKLAKELKLAAKVSGGTDLVSAGGTKPINFAIMTARPKLCYRLVCNCGLIYQNESKKLDKENGSCTVNKSVQYRKATLHNDRLNDRTSKANEKMSHRTGTCRRLTKNDPKCPFTLPLYVDQEGFLLQIGLGNPNHQYHVKAEVNKVSKVRAALLSEAQLKELHEGDRAQVGKAVARNMFFIRHGILLSTEQIRNIARNVDVDPECDNVVESLQRYFEQENAHCCFLYQKRQPQVALRTTGAVGEGKASALINEIHSRHGDREEISADDVDLNLREGEAKDVTQYAEGIRCARGVDDNQDLLFAFAWMLPEEHRQFYLYPFVVHIDGTNSTNKESRPLVTETGRDALGNQFTALRAFLPNNQAWVFKWLFQTVFPHSLEKPL